MASEQKQTFLPSCRSERSLPLPHPVQSAVLREAFPCLTQSRVGKLMRLQDGSSHPNLLLVTLSKSYSMSLPPQKAVLLGRSTPTSFGKPSHPSTACANSRLNARGISPALLRSKNICSFEHTGTPPL
eukprot:TRINITY_DN3051_c0_g1_i1.p1 TRINITY_DN3051_c0_g1~~TRINITY_DN3051_c0_g1_i1.p1  ORF type:complete len:128 (+),score=6.92 TRINITY_DN3051_c0_g1_i1:274-657(+)